MLPSAGKVLACLLAAFVLGWADAARTPYQLDYGADPDHTGFSQRRASVAQRMHNLLGDTAGVKDGLIPATYPICGKLLTMGAAKVAFPFEALRREIMLVVLVRDDGGSPTQLMTYDIMDELPPIETVFFDGDLAVIRKGENAFTVATGKWKATFTCGGDKKERELWIQSFQRQEIKPSLEGEIGVQHGWGRVAVYRAVLDAEHEDVFLFPQGSNFYELDEVRQVVGLHNVTGVTRSPETSQISVTNEQGQWKLYFPKTVGLLWQDYVDKVAEKANSDLIESKPAEPSAGKG